MLGISNYEPKFYNSTSDIIKELGNKLKQSIGKYITEIWVVWELNGNEWFKDCPVILRIGNDYVEFCATKFDEFAITWNLINITEKLDWYGVYDFKLEWKELSTCFQSVINRKINKICLIEYTPVPTVCFLVGIGFYLDCGYISITNGLDQNEICLIPEHDDVYKKTFIINS